MNFGYVCTYIYSGSPIKVRVQVEILFRFRGPTLIAQSEH